MSFFSKNYVLMSVCLMVVAAGCASVPKPRGLQPGVWELQSSDGASVDVKITELQPWEYHFDAGTHPISGIYAMNADSVSMVKPYNPRMKDYVWRVRADQSLILIDEPSVELSGQQLISSTMSGPR